MDCLVSRHMCWLLCSMFRTSSVCKKKQNNHAHTFVHCIRTRCHIALTCMSDDRKKTKRKQTTTMSHTDNLCLLWIIAIHGRIPLLFCEGGVSTEHRVSIVVVFCLVYGTSKKSKRCWKWKCCTRFLWYARRFPGKGCPRCKKWRARLRATINTVIL